jgi:hypothetical protein
MEKEEIKKLEELVSKSKKTSRYIALLSMVAAIIGFVVLITNVFHLTKQQSETVDSLQTNKLVIDSLINSKDSLTLQLSKKDSVINFIAEFLTIKKPDSTLDKYYADNIRKYYLRKDLSLNEIKKEKKQFVNDFPRSKLKFNKSDIVVNIKKDNTSEVFVNTLYYSDSLANPTEIIYQIKLNKKMKVYFIRNLKPESKGQL